MRVSGTIGIPHLETFPAEFVQCLLQLERPPATRFAFVKCAHVVQARNRLVEEMEGDWLFFLDADMLFPPDTLVRLLRHLQAGIPIVGGLCFRKAPPFTPTTHIQNAEGTYDILDPRTCGRKVVEVDATGMACCLIRRDVFDRMGPPWFAWTDVSEDLHFCRKAKALGFPIAVDTGLEIGHLTTMPIGMRHYIEHLTQLKAEGRAPQEMAVETRFFEDHRKGDADADRPDADQQCVAGD